MGLIVDSITVITPVVVDTAITDHIPSGRVCTDGSSSSTPEDSGAFDKSIYRVFSMQDDMKVLTYNGRPRNEFEQFLDAAVKKTSGLEYNTTFDSLDAYMGTIGVTNGIC